MRQYIIITILATLVVMTNIGCDNRYPIKDFQGNRYRLLRSSYKDNDGNIVPNLYERQGDTNRVYILKLGATMDDPLFVSMPK